MLPLLILDECFTIFGIWGAVLKFVNTAWWQLVQFIAVVFEVLHVLPSEFRYRTGWMLLLEFRWHCEQLTELLCRPLLFVKVALPPVPWHEDVQNVELGNDNEGFESVLLCILPVLWQVELEQSGFVPG